MAKNYYASGKPKGLGTEHRSFVSVPMRNTSSVDVPTHTRGKRLVKRRGFSTLATPVVVSHVTTT